MSKSTKAKCEEFALAHNLKLEVDGRTSDWFGVNYWIELPAGYLTDEGTTGMSGHDLCDMPKAEVWGMIMQDMKNLVEMEWVTAETVNN
jgi:hypothetical protein